MNGSNSVLATKLQHTVAQINDKYVPSILLAVNCPKLDFHYSLSERKPFCSDKDKALANSQFRIASVTKVFVAAAILRLQEMEKIAVDATLENVLSSCSIETLKANEYFPNEMTISQLLNHTSGMPDHACITYKEKVLSNPGFRWSRQAQLEFCMDLGKPLAKPSKVFCYSDTGYILLGDIIENITKKSLCEAIPQLLRFRDLSLNDTYWESPEPSAVQKSKRVDQYVGEMNGKDFDSSFDLYGGGGLVSTVEDLNKFIVALYRNQVFSKPQTIYEGLIVPPSERLADSHIHSRLAMVLKMGQSWGWGHLGFWGCAMVYNPTYDFAISLSINQADPENECLLIDVLSDLSQVVIEHLL